MADTEILVELSKEIGKISGTLEQVVKNQTEIHNKFIKDQDNHDSRISELENSKRRVVFTLSGISLALGAAGTKIGTVITALIGGAGN